MSLSRMVHTKRKASPTSQPSSDIFELQIEPLNKKGRKKEPSSTSLPQSLKSSPTKGSKFIIIDDDDDDDDGDISNSENMETNKDARSTGGSIKSVSPEKKKKKTNRPAITIIDDDEDDDDIDQVLLFDGAEGCLLESAPASSKDNEEPSQFTPVIETQQRDLALESSTQSETSQTKKLNTTPKKQSKSRRQESQPKKKTPSKSKSHRKRKSVITIKDDDDDDNNDNDDEYIDDDDEDDDYNGRASIRSMFLKAACSQSTSSSSLTSSLSSTTPTTAKRSLSFNSKNDFSSHNPFQSTDQTQQVQRKSSSSTSSTLSSTSAFQNSITEDKLFIDKYAPETISELAVSDSTVKAFTEWASSPQFRSSRRILIISGPSGSGKTTMVRVVCKELGYSAIEYSPYGGTSCYDAEGNLYSVTPVDDFRSWVLRAAKGPSILTPDSALRFLVIEDFPFINGENSGKFRAVFADYLRFPRAMPMIIIVSDSERYYRRSSKNMAYSIVTSFLLPTSEISPYVHSIKVNPVTLKKMRQALTKASAKCGVKMAMTTVNGIVQECGKDIRSALNMLQFSQSGFADRKINCRKDFELSLFHGAGKILHPRFRELLQDPHHPPLQPQVVRKAKSYPEHFLLESTGVRPHQIVECAVENMYDFISEMDNLADALEAISLGDSIGGRRGRAKQVHGGAMKMSEEAQMLVAAYGIMNNITVESHKFYGIHAPKLRSMENLIKENSKALATIFGEFVRKDDSLSYDGQQLQQQQPPPSWVLSKYALLTEIIPFSGHLNSEKECFRIVKELNYSIPDEIISDK